jgi:hypothetical protein
MPRVRSPFYHPSPLEASSVQWIGYINLTMSQISSPLSTCSPSQPPSNILPPLCPICHPLLSIYIIPSTLLLEYFSMSLAFLLTSLLPCRGTDYQSVHTLLFPVRPSSFTTGSLVFMSNVSLLPTTWPRSLFFLSYPVLALPTTGP